LGLREEIEANYIDAHGMVNPFPVSRTDIDKTGNGLLYTSFYLLQLGRYAISVDDLTVFRNLIEKCELGWGLLNRSPTKTEQMDMDDYYGICVVDKLKAWETMAYGQGHYWNFNNANPGKLTWSSWFGRAPWFVAHVKLCAGEELTLINKLALKLRIFVGSFGSSANGRLLDWLIIQAIGNSSQFKTVVDRWWRGLTKRYPNGMQGVMEAYFGTSHPLTKYWRD
jgi:hypothetical protein